MPFQASSLLAAIGSTLGITISFAEYTTLASTLSVALGPVGIGVLGLWGLHKISAPNTKVTILVVLAVAAIRERLIVEFPQRRSEINKEIENLMMQKESLEEILLQFDTLNSPNGAYALISDRMG